MALSLLAVWVLVRETHRGQQLTPALTLPQVRNGLSLLLLEVYCTPGIDYICRQVQRQVLRNESARFHHQRTRKCLPSCKLRRDTVGLCQPVVMLPTGWQTRAATPPTVPQHVLSHWHICEAKSFH